MKLDQLRAQLRMHEEAAREPLICNGCGKPADWCKQLDECVGLIREAECLLCRQLVLVSDVEVERARMRKMQIVCRRCAAKVVAATMKPKAPK